MLANLITDFTSGDKLMLLRVTPQEKILGGLIRLIQALIMSQMIKLEGSILWRRQGYKNPGGHIGLYQLTALDNFADVNDVGQISTIL